MQSSLRNPVPVSLTSTICWLETLWRPPISRCGFELPFLQSCDKHLATPAAVRFLPSLRYVDLQVPTCFLLPGRHPDAPVPSTALVTAGPDLCALHERKASCPHRAKPYPQLLFFAPLAPNRGHVQFARMRRAVLNQEAYQAEATGTQWSKKAHLRPDLMCRFFLFCT